MMKLCENCAFYKGHDGDMCHRPLSDARSPVTGKLADTLDRGCYGERRNDRTIFGRERCGPLARFYVPASGMEARQGGNEVPSRSDDSPAPQGDAQKQP